MIYIERHLQKGSKKQEHQNSPYVLVAIKYSGFIFQKIWFCLT